MAQGQAMMSTATALTSAKLNAGAGPNTSHTRKVSTAAAITAGTNHSVTLSTTAWMGSLPLWACSTSRMIWASTLALPTAVARRGEGAGLVDRAAHHAVIDGFGDGHGLAGDHGFVHIALAFPHRAVHGHALAGAHLDEVAGLHVGRWQLHPLPVALHARRLRLQADDPLYGLRGAALARASSMRPRRISATMTAAASKYTFTVPAGSRPGRKVATKE